MTSAAGNTITYAAKGNITRIEGIGTMTYGNSVKPYQVTILSPEGTAVPLRNQSVSYTSFQRPSRIDENGLSASFTYNASGERVKMYVANGVTPVLTRYYIGGQYELDLQSNTERLYLGGDAYSAPAVLVKEAGVWNIYYICRDYLGSITHLANADGSLAYEYSYDAWGRLRDPATQVVYTPGSEPALFLGRGYTTNVGYDQNSGFGMGHGMNGSNNMYYPSYDYNKPEKNMAEALERVTIEYRQYEEVKKDVASQTNWGLYLAGAALTGEDIYSNFFHNHTTYTTTKGVVKNIYKPNGQIRSARALQFSKTSKILKNTGVAGTALMTGTAAYNIGTGDGTVLDYSDATVGVVGLAGATASYAGYAIPGVGEVVAVYSWARLWFDLGAKYGPSKWYGNEDTRWFK